MSVTDVLVPAGASRPVLPVRTAAVWVPDWPVLAAMTAEGVDAHLPAAVHDGRRVVAVSATARRAGVRRGMRRRHAQECCPEIALLAADAGRDVRLFEPVATAAEAVVAGIEVARPGLLLLPAEGAGRYHGSEEVLAERLVDGVAERTGYEAQVGVADGAGAAVLAARAGRLVPPGGAARFLAPLAVGELLHVATGETAARVPELVDLLRRLGLRTLADLARLPAADVQTRFGALGAWAHAVASGRDDRPAALRRLEPDVAVEQEMDPPIERVEAAAFAARRLAEELHAQLQARGAGCGRLQITARTEDGHELIRTWRTDTALGGMSVARMTDRVRWQLEGWLTRQGTRRPSADPALSDPEPGRLVRLGLRAEEVVAVGAEQGRLWGNPSGSDLRAQRALHRVQGLIGAERVLTPALQGGREVRDQVALVPWGEEPPPTRPTGAPWPGSLPRPAPATVLTEPQVVQLVGADGRRVQVDARLQVSADPAVVWWPAQGDLPERETPVTGWAGPWPVVQRWWGADPCRAVYLQATLADGHAVLLALRDGVWAVEARYD
ncbi:DNA polymerase Y family protein [Actinotalea sp. JY-7876]|uniref:DNA polymerase Y family protein n=1 Tax=Actinotalea sp. JY-7876 TaxID=2758442 RepID=UPI0015F688BC|nr:DNA polymerase Y family protein [Actinotalea sp. JY-7876]